MAGVVDDLLSVWSGVFGWTYFFLWSASFYPQPWLNYKRKSTSGTTVDFPFINCLGYLCYLISNLCFYYSPLIREQYAARNRNHTPTVRFNDIVFALHALILSLITTSQYFESRLWKFGAASGSRPSQFVFGIFSGLILGVVGVWAMVGSSPHGDPAVEWCEIDIVYAISYAKVGVTLVKYLPQVITNWRNKSTEGWSIWQILLDVGGGFLSLAQLGIDSYLQRDWSGITGNPVKLAIGNASLFFDGVFLVQHYVLYKERNEGGADTERLLPVDDESGY